jgi:uncharacterized damage-inducible protein DinB
MTWIPTLDREIGSTYKATRMLMRMVKPDELGWRPDAPTQDGATGWMTMGQLLHHLTESCGSMCDCFAKDDWSILTEGGPAPMKSAASVDAALTALDADEALARKTVRTIGEKRLESERVTAPWGIEGSLGEQMLDSVKHLASHKSQLFYYLKLLGRPVNTNHLWGMDA